MSRFSSVFKILFFNIALLGILSAALFIATPAKKIVFVAGSSPFPADISSITAADGSGNSAVNDGIQTAPVFINDFSSIKERLISEQKKFLEVNLQKMKVFLYRGGGLVKSFPILRRGDPFGWGGTAVGLYQVTHKYREAYSVVAEVYMPYSLSFYGKYYLHGEPYDANGEKVPSDFSGGCVQLADGDAEEVFQEMRVEDPVLVIDKENDGYKYQNKSEFLLPEVNAKSYLVADFDSGFVLAERDSVKKLPIASLTKLMTAVIVTEQIDLRKTIQITGEMLKAYGSTDGMEEGKEFRVVELLYPLLIQSSNDAAEVLSRFLGRKWTINLMNEKAKAILMLDTEFIETSGYDPENTSTARDIFRLANYILNTRPLLWEITKGKPVRSFGGISFDVENLWNKNLFINDPAFLGGKTGYIVASRYTGVFLFKFNDQGGSQRNIAIVVLGSENLEQDVQRLYTFLQKSYFK